MTPWGRDSRSEAWLQEPRGRAVGAHGRPCNIARPHIYVRERSFPVSSETQPHKTCPFLRKRKFSIFPTMLIRQYNEADLAAMIHIWNEVVEEGIAFPQEDLLTPETGRQFFAAQTYCAVAVEDGKIFGLYILHPNNVGRCGHISNASYAVASKSRGKHIGEMLVKDCLEQAKKHGFGVLQFNAVVETNTHARHLYERLGFVQLGTIPKGFRMKDGHYENICPYYHEL